MKKYLLIILLSAYAARVLSQGSVTPSELLTIAFEDATGARDTVYIGHYMDSCYLYINPPPSCPKIVSPNIDTAFGEVDLGPFVQPGIFTARIENKMSDGFAYDWYTKYDIRYCDSTSLYGVFYNFFNDPLAYTIKFYYYTTPIIAKISIFRDSIFLPDSADKGCFCSYNPIFNPNSHNRNPNGWVRTWRDSVQTHIGYYPYDAYINPSLVDTLDAPDIFYYKFIPQHIIVGLEEFNNQNSDYKIYPLPFFNIINIEFKDNKDFYYRIINKEGIIIKGGKLQNKQIPALDIKDGIYTLILFNKTETVSFKIIKI